MRLTLSVTGKVGLGVSFGAEASFEAKRVRPYTVSMLRLKLRPITMMIGPVPVIVPWGFGVDLTPSINLNLGGVIKDLNLEIKRTATAYVAYEPARGGFIAGASGGRSELTTPDKPTVELTGEVSASLKLTLLFYITPYGIRESNSQVAAVCLLDGARILISRSCSCNVHVPLTTRVFPAMLCCAFYFF